jgi:hypothetical protein
MTWHFDKDLETSVVNLVRNIRLHDYLVQHCLNEAMGPIEMPGFRSLPLSCI